MRASAGRRWRCRSRDGTFDVVARLRRGRALRGRRAGGVRAGPGAAARRADAAVGPGVPVGVVRPRRPGRPPPPLHPAAARRGWSRAPGWTSRGRRTPSAAVFPLFVAERLRPPARGARPAHAATPGLPAVPPGAGQGADGLSAAGRADAAPPRPAVRLLGLPGGGQARRLSGRMGRQRYRGPRARPRSAQREATASATRKLPSSGDLEGAAPLSATNPTTDAASHHPASAGPRRPTVPAPSRSPSAPGWPPRPCTPTATRAVRTPDITSRPKTSRSTGGPAAAPPGQGTVTASPRRSRTRIRAAADKSPVRPRA